MHVPASAAEMDHQLIVLRGYEDMNRCRVTTVVFVFLLVSLLHVFFRVCVCVCVCVCACV